MNGEFLKPGFNFMCPLCIRSPGNAKLGFWVFPFPKGKEGRMVETEDETTGPREDPDRGEGEEEEEKGEGVLLYYKYARISDVPGLVRLFESNCSSLALLGRVRIAPDGVNVTIGGKMSSLERHIETMKAHALFEGTDFKLASCDDPRDERVTKECGFTSLAVRVVKELVTFSSHPLLKSPSLSHAGKHLSAVEFHSVLSGAGNKLDFDDPLELKNLVLLDARNIYETRIGMFHKSHVETLNPEIRQYSDLPAWIDEHSDQLKGNQVLMYCTGGIRCEMASAYIRSKGSGFGNVFQLYGGIQRYLEQFPDGGFFRGKNFVFDHRISVGSKNEDILGSCILCGLPFDDYSARCRCAYCRMLVLVCDGCQKTSSKLYVCELCQKHVNVSASQPATVALEDEQLQKSTSNISGTIQSEANLSVRLPHVAPGCYLPSNHVSGEKLSKKLRILCLHGFRQNASSFKGRLSSFAKKLKHIAELTFIDAPHEVPFIYQQCQAETILDSTCQPSPPPQKCKKRFAWFVAPQTNDFKGQDWKIADGPFDPYQYQQQTSGSDISHGYLKAKFSEMGPFDGVLGFSQGAAMAASVCEEQQQMDCSMDFRFAILCSGFSLSSSESKLGSIEVPSLHVYGSSKGGDRQIDCKASMELSRLFNQSCSKIIEHDMGHIIPAKAPYIDEIRDFLVQFL